MKSRYWLTIFFPSGVAWECGDGIIRTRNTMTGKIIMPTRHVVGFATSWLSAARNIAAAKATALDIDRVRLFQFTLP